MPDDDGRVTLAVIATKLDNLISNVIAWRDAATQERRELAAMHKDHEQRIVRLEGIHRLMIGAGMFLSPVVIWALIEVIKTLLAIQ